MKRNSIMAISALLFFAACNNESKDSTTDQKAMDSAAMNVTDTMNKGTGTSLPGAGNSGNTASGTSNAGINGKDTAAIGTNHSIGRDSVVKNKKH